MFPSTHVSWGLCVLASTHVSKDLYVLASTYFRVLASTYVSQDLCFPVPMFHWTYVSWLRSMFHMTYMSWPVPMVPNTYVSCQGPVFPNTEFCKDPSFSWFLGNISKDLFFPHLCLPG